MKNVFIYYFLHFFFRGTEILQLNMSLTSLKYNLEVILNQITTILEYYFQIIQKYFVVNQTKQILHFTI